MPVKIPKYNEQVNPSHQGDAYYSANTNPDAFGAGLLKAQEKLGESALNFTQGMSDIYENIVNSKVLELSNYIDELDKIDLSDPQNGYYSKLGKDAMRNDDDPHSGSMGVLTDIDNKIKQKQKELGLNWGIGCKKAELVKTKKMDALYKAASAHELNQTKAHINTQNEIAVNEALDKGIRYRNDDDIRETALNTGKTALLHNAQILHQDEASVKLNLQKYESDFHSAVIQQYLKDGDLKASEYFNKYQDKLLPQAQLKLSDSIRNNELKYVSKSIANDLFMQFPLDEAKAVQELDNKNLKPDEYDMSYREMRHLYSEKERLNKLKTNQLYDDFYNNALSIAEQGGSLSYDLIPDELNAKDKLSLMNYVNTNGRPKTDDSIYEELSDMRVSSADEFAELDLNKYRGFLSNSDYKHFSNEQKKIKQGGYYTVIKDDDKKIKKALNQLGLKRGKQTSSFNEIRYLVREFEVKRGRKIKNEELMDITQSLGYKGETGVQLYKSLEQGLAARTGFIRDVMTDFIQYQNEHSGQLPPDDVKDRIINNRIANTVQKQNEGAIEILSAGPQTAPQNYRSPLSPLPQGAREIMNMPQEERENIKKSPQYTVFEPDVPVKPPVNEVTPEYIKLMRDKDGNTARVLVKNGKVIKVIEEL